jgi:hypothetical protein
MTERPPGEPVSEADADARLDRGVVDALQAGRLDAGALDRMRAAVETEWRAAVGVPIQPRRQSRRALWATLAVAASIAVVSIAWLARSPMQTVAIGTIARLDSGRVERRVAILRSQALRVHDRISTGDTLAVQGPALVSLTRGGTLRIAAGSVVEVTSESQVSLQRGMIYLDKPPATGTLRVLTRAGVVEHVGTEFEVLSDDSGVRIRVREGRIRLLRPTGVVVADTGTELLAGPRGAVTQRHVELYGRDWLWVSALAPDIEIEGRTLIYFLQWVSRELGRRLDLADAGARDIAGRTILHGSVRGQEPLEALANVLATTSLSYEIREDTIRVHSSR